MDGSASVFAALKTDGITLLRRWRDERRQEDLHLDFKLAKSPMETNDKQNLATGISGFANSDGGVLVWGVMAAKDADGVDAVQDLRPISGLRRFLTNLTEYSSRLVVPAVAGVDSFIIPDPEAGDDCGFAVTYVPKAEGLPHMAVAKEQQRYYFRAGDAFLPMEHFMLADRFGRRPQPKLEMTHRWERPGNELYLVLGIANVGAGIALFPALAVEERSSDNFVVAALDEDWLGKPCVFGLPERIRTASRPSTTWRMFAGGGDHAIHPGTSIEVVQVSVGIPPRQLQNVDWKDISFRYSLYCDGVSLVDATATIPADEVARASVG